MQQKRHKDRDYVGLAVLFLLAVFSIYLWAEPGQNFIWTIKGDPDLRTSAIVVGVGLLVLLFFLWQHSKPVVLTPSNVWFLPVYIQTILWEWFGVIVRLWIVFFILLIVAVPFVFLQFIQQASEGIDVLGGMTLSWLSLIAFIILIVGCLPLLSSLLTFIDSRMRVNLSTVYALGAREPTHDELQKIIDGLEQITERVGEEKLPVPATWLVIDEPLLNSYTIGKTVFLTRELINSPHLVPAMAHEVGHITNGDAKKLLALRRLIIPLAYLLGIDQRPNPIGVIAGSGGNQPSVRNVDERFVFWMWSLRMRLMLAIWFGGIGLFFLARQWTVYWRQQDFLADRFVMECGFASEYLELLKLYQGFDVAQPFLLSARPYTAERIDRFEEYKPGLVSTSPSVSNDAGVVDEDRDTEDIAWINEHWDSLFPLAVEHYKSRGRGALVIDLNAYNSSTALANIWYETEEQLREKRDKKLVNMVTKYCPEKDIVVILLKPDWTEKSYLMTADEEKA